MKKKRFIPCIYLYKGIAVKNLNDVSPISMNPLELANIYTQSSVDELLLFDMSSSDEEHEESLRIIKQIATMVEVPVIGAGNVKRMEDVKKLLYAGCHCAVLNFSLASNVAIAEEVSKKFGKEKIMASVENEEQLIFYKDVLEAYCHEVIVMDFSKRTKFSETVAMHIIGIFPEISLDKMLAFLSLDYVIGISGAIVNENIKDIHALKSLCVENDIPIVSNLAVIPWSELTCNTDGMVPVVTQDYKTNEVLMVAYMNEEAYQLTIKTGKMTYFSRSRNQLWLKGETSGHFQYVKALYADCDKDTLLAKVSQVGVACHTGKYSCFFNEILKKEYNETNPLLILENVFSVIMDRKEHPKEGSYTNYLFEKGIDKILKKLGEEATEIIIAAKNPNPDEIKYEISDFLYHMMVLMAEKNVTWEEIANELASR